MDALTNLVGFFESYYISSATAWPQFAIFYGWLAAASFVPLLAALLFFIFRREQAGVILGGIGQFVLILGIPWLIGPAQELFSSF